MIPLLLPVMASEYDLGMENLAISKASAGFPCKELIVTDEGGLGFTQAFNRGVRALLSGAWEWDCVCILSSDLKYEQQSWLRRLRDVLHGTTWFGLVGPSVRCGTSPQKTGRPGMPFGHEVVKHLNFTGVLIKRAVFSTIDLLNEEYKQAACDFDFVHRAQEQSWDAVWVRDVWCEHDWTPGKYPEFEAVDRPLYYSRWTKAGERVV